MTGTDVAVRRPQGQAAVMQAKLAYAQELADSGLLPRHYQQRPANILWAMEYAEMLGLAPMAAMTGVHVIEGKPSASAGLISGLVRQAGHQLRVWGDNKSATCEITRSDDPAHPFSVTWTLKREPGDNPSAEQAKLLGKEVWQKYPASMLKSRAITQCARDACEEVLFGLHYTPEELGAEVDEDGAVVAEAASEPAQPAERSAGTPGDDPWYVRPAPEAGSDEKWLAAALEAAPGHATLDACGVIWRKSAEKVGDGTLTKADAARLQAVLRVRIEELKAAQAAGAATEAPPCGGDSGDAGVPALDPDDPWAPKVDDLTTSGDASDAITELLVMLGNDEISAEHAGRVEAAILARFPDANADGQVAA
jgi:hypothetical protein